MYNTKVLRASRIGSLCDRALFYSVNGVEEISSEKSQRIFEVGKILEPVIISWLRSDGWNVRRNLFVNSNEGMSLSISVNGGTIEAHPDCVISREDNQLILADIKTMNDRSFRSLKRDGTANSHPQYADQLTIYAQALRECGHNIDQLAIVALNKNNSEGFIDFFQCELAKKDTAVGDESVPATDNQEVIDAVELLSESRELKRTGKELADEAKTVLDKLIRQQGIRSVRCGNLILILNEIKSSRIDTTALKKAHPELRLTRRTAQVICTLLSATTTS